MRLAVGPRGPIMGDIAATGDADQDGCEPGAARLTRENQPLEVS
jgi:hypothetical protein